jgi:predicted DNA-binding protein YlxM (UPF0122 family)
MKQIEIAKYFSAGRGTISDIIKNLKIKTQSKIDKNRVKEMYNSGMKQIEIAKYFNTSRGYINDIIKK